MTDDEKRTLIELFLSPDTTNFMVAVEILKGQEPLDIYSTLMELRKAAKELARSKGATTEKSWHIINNQIAVRQLYMLAISCKQVTGISYLSLQIYKNYISIPSSGRLFTTDVAWYEDYKRVYSKELYDKKNIYLLQEQHNLQMFKELIINQLDYGTV